MVPLRFEVSLGGLVAPPAPASGDGTLVTVGGVHYDAQGVEEPSSGAVYSPMRGGGRGSLPASFKFLKQTRYEAEDLGDSFEDHFDQDPLVLLEEQATKKALVESAPSARFLHLATHGWFAPETFSSTRDLKDEDLAAGLTRADRILEGFAPETLCGLALAGADHGVDQDGRVPGILTAEELATLDLSNCEMAVLSACETNVASAGRDRASSPYRARCTPPERARR